MKRQAKIAALILAAVYIYCGAAQASQNVSAYNPFNPEPSETDTTTAPDPIVDVEGAPTILAQPSSKTLQIGTAYTLSIVATADAGATLRYEWFCGTTSNHDMMWPYGNGQSVTADPTLGVLYYACKVVNELNAEKAWSDSARVEYTEFGDTGGDDGGDGLGEDGGDSLGGDGGDTGDTGDGYIAAPVIQYLKPTVGYNGRQFIKQPDEEFVLSASVTNTAEIEELTLSPVDFSYQWYSGSSAISNATGRSLSRSITSTQSFKCVATYIAPDGVAYSSESGSVTVQIVNDSSANPQITAEPQDITVGQGESKTISIIAVAPDEDTILEYRWNKSTEYAKLDDGLLEAETASSVTVDSSLAGTWYYYCVVNSIDKETKVGKGSTSSRIVKVDIEPSDNAEVKGAIYYDEGIELTTGITMQLSLVGTIAKTPEEWILNGDKDSFSLEQTSGIGTLKVLDYGKATITAKLPGGVEITREIEIAKPTSDDFIQPWMWSIPTVISLAGCGAVMWYYYKNSRPLKTA